ncbi:tape measure protein [Dokdonella soli]
MVAIQDRLFSISQETGRALDDTAKIYQRLEQVIEGTGKSQIDSQAQALAISKTLNQEMTISGATTAEATRAITDMVHGMAGGVLQARQLRMMMQQMPDLARVLAEGLGTNVKGLEAMVHAGLPVEQVLKALENEAGKVDARFQDMPKTFARVWTELSNAVEQYIGRASQAGSVSGLVKDAISGLARNIDTVATAAELAGGAMAAWLGGKGLQTISGIAYVLRDAVTAQGAYKTAAMASAEADIANAAAKQQAVAATVARIDSNLDLAQSELQLQRAAAARLMETNALAEADIALLPVGQRIAELESQIAAGMLRAASAE